MSQHPDQIRRRPFSVSDAYGRQQRCQEVKISNTTTITTCSTSQDAAAITTTTYRNVDARAHHYNHQANVPTATSYTTVKKHEQTSSRSRSAFATTTSTANNQPIQHVSPCHPGSISTNTSITLPIKRKIKFVYGGDETHDGNQQNQDPSRQQQQQQQQSSQPQTSSLHTTPNKGATYEIRRTGDCSDDLPAFPFVKHSVQTKLPCSTITNCVEINNNGGRCTEEYDNYEVYNTTSNNVNRDEAGDMDIGKMNQTFSILLSEKRLRS
jgi:hypothetical protein